MSQPLVVNSNISYSHIISKIGTSGMSEVFLAHYTNLNRIEKGEHKGKAGDGQFLKRGTCVKI